MKICYFDCFSGAAGDMILGALLDAGASEEKVRAALQSLGLSGWELSVDDVTKGGLRATKATVDVVGADDHRSYEDVTGIVEASALPEPIAQRAAGVFRVLAEAEARVHGVEVTDIHFHEVGATDAIVDIVGSCAALDSLAPDVVVCSPLRTGTGEVASSHGTLPLPAPAVTEMLERARAPLIAEGSRELTTPTGAALLISFADRFGPPPPLRLEATGYGAGNLELERPNVLRVLIGETVDAPTGARPAIVIDANIDDMNPETFPHVLEMLMAAGAQDAWVTPIVMKKGRPGHMLSVLSAPDDRDRLVDIVFRETTTLGLRVTDVAKDELERTWVEVDIEGQPVRVKLALRGGVAVTAAPEYEDARRAARATGLSLKEIYARAASAPEVRRAWPSAQSPRSP